jgi:4-hydroxyproline epimerase
MAKIYQQFECIDAHTCGNPVRLVKTGGPVLKGNSMSEKRQHFLQEFDWIRKGLMFEPRGHDMMSGSILYPPTDEANDCGVLYIETSGCLPMCGHGTIGTVTIMIQEKLVIPKIPGKLRLETPAGLVLVDYQLDGDRVSSVKLTNVKSFLHSTNLKVVCSGLGELTIDVAYGGNFYAIVDPQTNFNGFQDFTADYLISWSREIRKKLNELYEFIHPEDTTIYGLSHLLWSGKVLNQSSTARNAVFYGEKAIDRSPCGTGTSARMAQWHAKGLLKKGEDFIHESIIGSKFIGRIEEETSISGNSAIVPSIEGWARITGKNTIIIDENDPYAFGFQVI